MIGLGSDYAQCRRFVDGKCLCGLAQVVVLNGYGIGTRRQAGSRGIRTAAGTPPIGIGTRTARHVHRGRTVGTAVAARVRLQNRTVATNASGHVIVKLCAVWHRLSS